MRETTVELLGTLSNDQKHQIMDVRFGHKLGTAQDQHQMVLIWTFKYYQFLY